MINYVMKSLKLNPENDSHRKAIRVISQTKNFQQLVVKLLIEHSKKMEKIQNGDLLDE